MEVMSRHKIDIVIPTCEEVFYLAQIWQTNPPEAALFAPHIERLEQVHNKFRFIQLCQHLGLATPETHLLRSREDLEGYADHADHMVFKPVWSRFATHVLICPRPRQLTQIAPCPARPWIAQQFIQGDEISVYAVAHSGRLTALSAYRRLIGAGRGASVCFEPVQDQAVRDFVEAFVAETNWTGQVSFDLIRDKNGRVLALECNPRATSGVHFFGPQSGLSEAFLSSTGRAVADITTPQGVRLAMWLYGPSNLLSAGGAGRFCRAVRQVQDVLKQPEDPVGLWPQARSVMEFARIALRRRINLQTASTFDIEWDGPDQSSIS